MSDARSLDQLLAPSLRKEERLDPPYSVRACFWVAFFGGVFGLIILSTLNSLRGRRLARDLWLYALAGVAWAAFSVWAGRLIAVGTTPVWLAFVDRPETALRLVGRLTALVFYGIVYLRHRAFFSAGELGGATPSAWKPGIPAIVVGAGLTYLLEALGGLLVA